MKTWKPTLGRCTDCNAEGAWFFWRTPRKDVYFCETCWLRLVNFIERRHQSKAMKGSGEWWMSLRRSFAL